MKTALDRWFLRNPMPPSFTSKAGRTAYFSSMPEQVRREWDLRKAKLACEELGYNKTIVERAQKRMMRVDQFPPDVRRCIYEYGLEIVQEFWNHGVRKASSISHLVGTVRGEYTDGRPRFALNQAPNGKRNPARYDPEDDYEYSIPNKSR